MWAAILAFFGWFFATTLRAVITVAAALLVLFVLVWALFLRQPAQRAVAQEQPPRQEVVPSQPQQEPAAPREEQPAAPAAQATPTPVQGQAFGQPPQRQRPHPSSYNETGTVGTITWALNVPSDKVLIVGGFCVDGICDGVYRGFRGGQTVTITVADGFYAITQDEWGQQEFCFRLSEAREFGWAHNTVQPLPEWAPCS